jgi:hypothetical protein
LNFRPVSADHDDGVSDFDRMRAVFGRKDSPDVFLYVFDVLELDGRDHAAGRLAAQPNQDDLIHAVSVTSLRGCGAASSAQRHHDVWMMSGDHPSITRMSHSFECLPRRIFLDSCTAQMLRDYDSYIVEGEPVAQTDRIHRIPDGIANLEALRAIFLINQRALWIVSAASMKEARVIVGSHLIARSVLPPWQ